LRLIEDDDIVGVIHMPKEFISPNWHAILIHYPLGVFMLGLILEVALLVFRHRGTARTASRWMVVLGALCSLPAAYAGMYALSDVTRRTAPPGAAVHGPWYVVSNASTLTPAQWSMIDDHLWKSSGAAVLAAVLVTLGVALTDRWRDRLYPILLILLLGCAVIMGAGAWYGGEMVYREGIAVRLGYHEDERAEAQTRPVASIDAPATRPGTSSAAQEQVKRPAGLDYYVNPMQLHVTLAGIAAAMGLLAIGLSLRAAATSPHWRDPELDRAGVEAMPHPQRGGAYDVALLRSFAPQVEITGEVESIPAARFWLLVFVGAIGTALVGAWVLARGHQTLDPKELWKLVTADGCMRRLAHVIAGGSIIVLPLLMALLSRIARRSRAILGLFSLLLVAALAAQVWLGILLMFDQAKVSPDAGPWYRFQKPAASIAATQPSA
jgi:uncharacterized membrane protein